MPMTTPLMTLWAYHAAVPAAAMVVRTPHRVGVDLKGRLLVAALVLASRKTCIGLVAYTILGTRLSNRTRTQRTVKALSETWPID